jgi:hypothetical protein
MDIKRKELSQNSRVAYYECMRHFEMLKKSLTLKSDLSQS